MARRRRYGRRRRGHGMKLPVISLAILVGQGAAAYDGTVMGTAGKFAQFYTGIDMASGSFDGSKLLIGYGPWLVKRFVGAVARPRMPIHGLPISLS